MHRPEVENLNTPRDFVQSGWDYFRELGGQWITLSQQALADLAFLNITPIAFDASFDLNVDYASFVRPIAPVVPDLGDITATIRSAPAITPITITALGAAPVEPNFSSLTYVPPAPPTAALPTAPSDIDVVLDAIVLPTSPTYVLPALPTLYTLNLPAVPVITIPEFTAVRPSINLDAYLPDRAFNWQEVAYSSALLDSVKTHLTSMMKGGLGLPAAIEQAIFDRGRSRADMLATKRVQEVADELAARGLSEPSGYLARRLDQARQEGRAESAGLNKDITIRSAEIEIESIKFAIAQAGALETTLLQLNGQINQRALEAAKIASDIQVAVFNAIVTRFNLDIEMYKADAEVFRDRIQAAIAQAELYKSQIEGQKAIGDVNESLIRSYTEQVRSIGVLADIYRAQIEGAKAQAEINTQRLEQAKIRIQKFGVEVEAFKGIQEAYRIQVDGALGNVKVMEAIGGVYGRRVEAYKTLGDAYIQQGQFQVATQQLGIDGFKAELEGARTLITAQSASIDAKARTFSARAGMYEAEGRVVSAEAESVNRTVAQRIAVAEARANFALRNAELRISQNTQIASLYVEQLKAKAQVISQLASSTMSGVNFGASYSGSLGFSYSKSAGVSWSGEIQDNTTLPHPGFNF